MKRCNEKARISLGLSLPYQCVIEKQKYYKLTLSCLKSAIERLEKGVKHVQS